MLNCEKMLHFVAMKTACFTWTLAFGNMIHSPAIVSDRSTSNKGQHFYFQRLKLYQFPDTQKQRSLLSLAIEMGDFRIWFDGYGGNLFFVRKMHIRSNAWRKYDALIELQ